MHSFPSEMPALDGLLTGYQAEAPDASDRRPVTVLRDHTLARTDGSPRSAPARPR